MTDSRAEAAAREIHELYSKAERDGFRVSEDWISLRISRHYAPVVEELSSEKAMRAIDLQTMNELKSENERLRKEVADWRADAVREHNLVDYLGGRLATVEKAAREALPIFGGMCKTNRQCDTFNTLRAALGGEAVPFDVLEVEE